MESNFDHESSEPRFRALSEKYQYTTLQIECTAPEEKLVERFEERRHSGRRHPGHGEQDEGPNGFREHMEHTDYGPMDLEGEVLSVDTTGQSDSGCAGILDEVRTALRRMTSAHQS